VSVCSKNARHHKPQHVSKCCLLVFTQAQSRFLYWSLARRQWFVWSQLRPLSVAASAEPSHEFTFYTRVPACSPKSCNLIDGVKVQTVRRPQLRYNKATCFLNQEFHCWTCAFSRRVQWCYCFYKNSAGGSRPASNFSQITNRQMNNDHFIYAKKIIIYNRRFGEIIPEYRRGPFLRHG